MVYDMKTKDPYKILGIASNASEEDIKKAYRKLAMKWHPDKNQGNPDATKKFRDITEAYDMLKNPSKKSSYDDSYPHAKDTYFYNSNSFEDFLDIFNFNFGTNKNSSNFDDLFIKMAERGRSKASRKAQDIQITLGLTLEELCFGAIKKVAYDKTTLCPRCHNTVPHKGCPRCNDSGYITSIADFEVSIPKHTHDGAKLEFPGEGNYNGTYSTSKLIITIKEIPHAIFRRENKFDIYCTKELTFSEAALGTVLTLKNLQGASIRVTVPPGIQSGTKLCLKSQGISDNYQGIVGDMYIEIQVATPTDLTKDMKSLFNKLKELEMLDKVIV